MTGPQSIEASVNGIIRQSQLDTNKISDGYHTFGELYEHRIVNYIALHKAKYLAGDDNGFSGVYGPYDYWKSKVHSDGSIWDGWFLLGIGIDSGQQITYHLPMKYWDQITWAHVRDQAPDFDGHTSQDVLDRIAKL